jgi:3'(2'), 5'-bisphosphate nucleotidase
MSVDSPPLRTAIRAVAAACRVTRSLQQDLERLRRITKDDRSPVTVADFAAQAIVAMELRRADPDTLIVGEEHANTLRQDEHATVRTSVVEAVRGHVSDISEDEVLEAIDAGTHDATAPAYWTLDPVDGTKGFLRGQQYAIALAFIEGGRVTHGVMGCPALPADPAPPLDVPDATGTLYAASADAGTWALDAANPDATPQRIQVAALADDAPVRACESLEAAHSSHSDTDRVLERIGRSAAPVRLDSQCKYALVARGQADAYLRLPTSKTYVEKIWDHAAGMLIATEAGGVVSDAAGHDLDFGRGRRLESNRGIVCAVPTLHEPLVQAIADLGIAAPV